MYLIAFLNHDCQLICSLHSTRPAAEVRVEALLRRYIVGDGELPPKARWAGLCDSSGESPRLFEIELDGKPGKEISLSDSEDLATA